MNRTFLKTLLEAGLWIGFAVIGFIYSFEFNQNIDIYRFDATGWPRAVLVFIVLAALAHLYQVHRDQKLAGTDSAQGRADGKTETMHTGRYLRLLAMLALPVVYAFCLEPFGFYATTPLFILLFLILAEERRWQYLIGISLGLYAILVFVFGKLLFLSLPVGNVQMFYDFSNWLLTVIQ